jgi:periplasmic protein CpxP/Spy
MKALKSLALAASLVLVAAAPPVLAQPGHGAGHGMHRGMHGMPGMQLMHALDDVGATDAQREQIHTIFKTAREELRSQMQDGRGQHQQMLKLWAQPNIDAAAIDALRKQQQAQHERVAARMQAAFIEAGRVLTPEQRAKIAEKAGQRAERMKQRMERKQGEHAGKH